MTVSELIALFKTASGEELERLLAEYEQDSRVSVQKACVQARTRMAKEQNERIRVHQLYEACASLAPHEYVLGIDEVGRGCLAGPLTVAGVILPADPEILYLNDSKQLSPAQRAKVVRDIKRVALASTCVHIPAEIIDEIGIVGALKQACREVIEHIDAPFQLIALDGNPLRIDPREVSIVKGDARISAIAAASILAKVTRDTLMEELSSQYPDYGFEQSKGYGSPQHIAAIQSFGLTDQHRRTFCKNFITQASDRLL